MTQAGPKSWFITGVSSGLGLTLAEAVLAQGGRVVGTVRKPADVAAFETLAPGRATAVVLDVTQADTVDAGVKSAASTLGRIDVVVNNAGFGLVGAVEETSDAEARMMFDANLFGQLNVLRSVLPILRAQRSGHIIANSSVGGFTGFAGLGVYSGAKAAVDIMSEALAQEVAPFGIKVTILTMGIFHTKFASSSLKQTAQNMDEYAETPAGQLRGFIGQLQGKQPNDPVRGAQAILELVASDKPPLHLALGQDAVGVMEKKIAGLQADLNAWRNVSASVAYAK